MAPVLYKCPQCGRPMITMTGLVKWEYQSHGRECFDYCVPCDAEYWDYNNLEVYVKPEPEPLPEPELFDFEE